MKKFTKILSVLLSVLLIWQSFGANLGLKASAAGTGELSIVLGAAQPGATINNIKTYYYPDAVVTGSDIKTILLSFSESVTGGDKIILPDSTYGFTVSGTSVSNNYTKRINTDTGITGTDNAAAVQTYLRGIGFQLAGTSQSVKVTVTTENILYDTFYNVDTQHYYQYVPFTTTKNATWVDAYNAAENMEYMNRSGYLATVTSYDEDIFLNSLSNGSVGWLGGTALTNNGESGSLYYSGFNTSVTSKDNWYWADGPERGRIFYYGRSTDRSSNGAGTSPYWNWGNSTEPNGNTSVTGENCLSTLNRLSIDNQKGYHGTDFSWNDIVWNTENEGDFSAKGFFVEYGNMTPGDSATSATGYASVTGSLSSTSYAASISGSIVYGQTLTANLTGGSATAYQWKRDDGSISGATGRTYTLTAADVGHQIAVKIAVGGTAVTSPTVEVTALPVAGSGSALSFDGTNDYVDLGSSVTVGNKFTEEVWVYPTASNDWSGVIGNEKTDGDSTSRSPCILIHDGDSDKKYIQVGFGSSGGWMNLYVSTPIKTNAWNHIAFVYDGNTIYAYVNGLLGGTTNCDNAVPCSTPISYIGKVNKYTAASHFNGQLDEVKIWNTAHTQDEIRSDMYSHPASGTTGLTGYWSFDEGSASTAADYSGNGKDGTLTNMNVSSCWTDSGAWQNRMTAENIALTMDAGYSQDGGSVTIAQTSAPQHGALAFDNSNKTVTYTPANGFYGSDSFAYTVTEYGVSKSYTVDMTVVQKPDVTVDGQTATVGSTATFTAAGSVGSGTLTYQWQKSTDGASWDNVTDGTGGATSSYTTPELAYTDNNSQYRCLVTNTIGFTSVSSTSAAATLTVNKKTQGNLTVTGPTNNTMTYGDNFQLSISGGDGRGTYGYQTTNSSVLTVNNGKLTAVGVGQATITVTRMGDSDYGDSAPSPITITVNPKSLDVTITPKDKTYDGGTTADVNSVNYAGFVSLDNVDSVYITGGSLFFSDENSGNGKTVTASGYSLTGTKKDDYKIGTVNVNNASINKRTVIPLVTANSKTYNGGMNATGTISLSGVVNSDDVTASGTFAFADKNAGTGKTVSVTGMTLSGAKAGNYMLSAPNMTATADIMQKTLNVTNTAVKDKTYDGKTSAEFSGAPALSGVIGSDDVMLTNGTPSFESANASDSAKVDFSDFSIFGNDASNYALTQPADGVVTAKINKKALAVSVNPVTIFCGQSIPTLTVKIDGFVNNETENGLTGFAEPTACPVNFGSTVKSAGTYPMPVSYTGGTATGNYYFTFDTAAFIAITSVSANGNYTVTPSVPDGKNGWYVSDLTIKTINGFDQISTDGTNWNPLLAVSTEANSGSITFKLKKTSDNTQTESKTIYYNLDKTIPNNVAVKVHQNSFTTFLNAITFGLFFKNDVDVTLSASDALSGVDYYEYQLVDTSKGQSYKAENTWTKTDSGTFSVSPQFKGAVYAYAVDKAGNKSTVSSSDGFVADSQTPTAPVVTATVNGSNYNNGTWVSGDVKLVASGPAVLSGIDHYEYKIGDGAWTTMPDQSGTKDSTSENSVSDSLTITSDMNNDIHIRAVSNSKMTGSESIVTVQRDSVTPILGVNVSGTAGQWTNSPVTFTLSNTANNISPVIYWEKIGSGDWKQISGNTVSLTTDTNTTYQFKAVSGSVLQSDAGTVYTVKLDVDGPTISGVSGNPTNWTNGDATLTVNATDTVGSDIKEYSFNGGNTWQAYKTNTYSSNTTIPAGSIKVKDNAGNITSYNADIVITKIDKTVPTITDVTGNPAEWTNNDATLTVHATDDASGVCQYSFDGGYNWQTRSTNTYSSNTTIPASKIEVKDNAGNIASYNTDIAITKIDKAAPMISDVTGNPTNWTNGDATLTVDATDTGGSDIKEYSFNGGNNWQDSRINTYSSNTTIPAGSIKVKDNAGNITSYNTDIAITKIDKAAPTISDVTGNPTNWTNGDATLTVDATDTGGSDIKEYSFNGGNNWQDSRTNTYSSNTTILAGSIKVKDNAGNITSYNMDIDITKIDKTAPANLTITITSNLVKQVLHAVSFGLFFNDTVDVALFSTDNLSGTKNYEYQLVNDGGTPADNAWTTCGGSFSVDPQFKGTIYARAADNAGNISLAAESDKFVTDKQAPTAPSVAETAGGKAYDGTNWTSGNINLASSGSTALSGIDYYEYSTDNGDSWAKMEG